MYPLFSPLYRHSLFLVNLFSFLVVEERSGKGEAGKARAEFQNSLKIRSSFIIKLIATSLYWQPYFDFLVFNEILHSYLKFYIHSSF